MFGRAIVMSLVVSFVAESCFACNEERSDEEQLKWNAIPVDSESFSTEEMSRLWQRASEIDLDTRCPDWYGTARRSFFTVVRFCRARNREDCMAFLCSQFGQQGAINDFFLIGSLLNVGLLPHHTADVKTLREEPDWVFDSEIAATEQMVRIISTDPVLRKRLYQAIVWNREYFRRHTMYRMTLGRAIIHLLNGEVNEGQDPEYWWYCYDVIMAIEATGQDELLRDADPEKLLSVVRKWYEWLKENGAYLRALPDSWYWVVDEGEKRRQEGYVPFLLDPPVFTPLVSYPEVPFPDWPVGVRPPRPGVLCN